MDKKNNIIIYQGKGGVIELRADIKEDTIWATQAQIAELCEINVRTISEHLQNIFKTEELDINSVIRKFRNTGADGKSYETKFYNLDAIIAVGYRVNSKKATQFRIWATGVLREYLKNGYVLQEYKLKKNPEVIEGLQETLALITSNKYKGKLKGKLTLKITKNMEGNDKT
jgi:hypothetical protein